MTTCHRLSIVALASIAALLFTAACDTKPKNARKKEVKHGKVEGFLVKNGGSVYAANPPLIFAAEKDVPAPMTAACERAAKTLNTAAGRELIKIESSVDRPFRLRWLFKAMSLPTHQASTDLYIDGQNRITAAEIHFDHKNFVFNDAPDSSQVDNESVCLHEFGHAVGLDHSTDETSFMHVVLKGGQIRRTLSPGDVKILKKIY